ncbi:Got1/Sft2-like family [Musa troglodytarum]|uniref:Got1/Sft2-like family n=1 Tax=Musa troglodytarum TaxID=320322 RepID=A0A9E7FC73_9LILI|nr:Got1/Sft2-like family [Musa troglodytarum]
MRTAQAWFTGGPSGGGGGEPQKPSSSSLLADRNSYAASRSTEEGGVSAFGFDVESAVQSANDEVTGTFSVAITPRRSRFCWSEKGTSFFSLALANAFGSADNLVATSLDSYGPPFPSSPGLVLAGFTRTPERSCGFSKDLMGFSLIP